MPPSLNQWSKLMIINFGAWAIHKKVDRKLAGAFKALFTLTGSVHVFAHVPQHPCGSQRAFKDQFSPFVTRGPGIELRSLDLANSTCMDCGVILSGLV